uniref:Uncharacterized protein n=1 Tax=Anguilla anguilla TaxID=7936 RepID=A0A0E9T042_ANGAN
MPVCTEKAGTFWPLSEA